MFGMKMTDFTISGMRSTTIHKFRSRKRLPIRKVFSKCFKDDDLYVIRNKPNDLGEVVGFQARGQLKFASSFLEFVNGRVVTPFQMVYDRKNRQGMGVRDVVFVPATDDLRGRDLDRCNSLQRETKVAALKSASELLIEREIKKKLEAFKSAPLAVIPE
eukprot:405988_1